MLVLQKQWQKYSRKPFGNDFNCFVFSDWLQQWRWELLISSKIFMLQKTVSKKHFNVSLHGVKKTCYLKFYHLPTLENPEKKLFSLSSKSKISWISDIASYLSLFSPTLLHTAAVNQLNTTEFVLRAAHKMKDLIYRLD